MNDEKFIVDCIKKLSGKHTPYQIFSDWICMSAMAIQNAFTFRMINDKIYKDREDIYMSVSKRYSMDELKTFSYMTGALSILMEERFCDVLGDIYMKAGCGSKNTGQFFTPYHLSYLAANLAYENQFYHLCQNDKIEINEPSTGGGGMIIALAQVMKEHGIDYQKKLQVIAHDLDWNCVYMTYIQLSLLGIKAIVVQGDTLCESYRRGYDEIRVFRTPAELGVLL